MRIVMITNTYSVDASAGEIITESAILKFYIRTLCWLSSGATVKVETANFLLYMYTCVGPKDICNIVL